MADPGVTPTRIACWATRHTQALDLILGAFLALAYLTFVRVGDYGPHQGRAVGFWDVVAATATVALVVARRRWPRTVLGIAVGITTISIVAGEPRAATVPAVLIAAYTVSTLHTRRTAWLLGGSAGVLLFGATLIWPSESWPNATRWERGSIGLLAAVGMAVAIGDAIRTRRAYVAAVEERARRAEESREEEAHRRVIEERLRIARELHDVVAHNLALISVQAGVATHLMRRNPEQAATALGLVRRAANTAVDELGTVLAVLREDGDPEPTTEPAPGLAKLPALLESVAAAGLTVRYRQNGSARTLPAAADLAAYRIIQESLTNAHKHGAGAATHLHVAYTDEGVTIDITNPVAAGPLTTTNRTGTGHGLIGMRERAASVGGTLRAGPEAGNTFAVHAVVPAPNQPGEPL